MIRMFKEDPEREEFELDDGKKVLIYVEYDEEINQFQESTKFFGDFLIEYIYDKNGKLISKELKKNPNFKEDMIDYPEGMI